MMEQQYYRSIKIFIATPGDLNPERTELINVVTEVNRIKAHHMGFHLEVRGWERTLPGLGRPQSLINEEIRNCDLFIMALWERWGTPSGVFSSGTEEEFYEAKKLAQSSGRPAMWVFFKDTTNPNEKINEFKEQRQNERDVFYKTFQTLDQWRDDLRSFLCKWLDSLEQNVEFNDAIEEKKRTKHLSNILYRISYHKYFGASLHIDPVVFFTIEDEQSLLSWKKLTPVQRKEFVYNRLSENLGLILGAAPYMGQFRYKVSEDTYILLATISRYYEDSLEQSRVYIPRDYSQICTKSDAEVPFEGYI